MPRWEEAGDEQHNRSLERLKRVNGDGVCNTGWRKTMAAFTVLERELLCSAWERENLVYGCASAIISEK